MNLEPQFSPSRQFQVERLRRSLERLKHSFDPYRVSFIGIKAPFAAEFLGSGVRCRLEGRFAVVTAWHVIAQGLNSTKYPLGIGYSGDPRFPFARMHGEVLFRDDHDGDLAVYFPPESYRKPLDYPDGVTVEFDGGDDGPGKFTVGPLTQPWSFWPEERILGQNKLDSTDLMCFSGYPGIWSGTRSAESHPLHKEASNPHLAVEMKHLLYAAMIHDDFKVEPFQFTLRFGKDHNLRKLIDEQGNDVEDVPHPAGLSGSPVWQTGGAILREDWDVGRCSLAGILTNFPGRNSIVATKAALLRNLSNDPAWQRKPLS